MVVVVSLSPAAWFTGAVVTEEGPRGVVGGVAVGGVEIVGVVPGHDAPGSTGVFAVGDGQVLARGGVMVLGGAAAGRT